MADDARHVNRLRWACRRGDRELDLLLSWYLETCYREVPWALQKAFAELLELDDLRLRDHLTGRAPARNRDHRDVIQAMQLRSGNRT